MVSKVNPYHSTNKLSSLGGWSILNYDVLRSSTRAVKKHSEEIIKDLDKSIKEAFIEYKTQNTSSFWSYLINPNQNNYMEGRKFLQDDLNFVKSEIKVGVFRFRRIICEIEGWSELFMEIFRVKYLKWTVFITVLFHIFLLVADMNSLHLYFLFLICGIIGLSHRTSINFLTERVFPFLRNPKDLNPDYWEPIVHTKTYLKDHRFLQIELLRKKLQPAEGIISDLKLIKMLLHMGPTFMHKLANLFEKIKNMLTWYETRRTKALVFVLVIAVFIFHLISFKLVILAGYWGFLTEQSRYYKSHLKRNREIATKVLEQIVAKNFEKYHPMKFDKEFPFLSNENEFANFRKKIIQKIEKHLDIELPNGLVQGMSKLDDLVYLLASTNEQLKVFEPLELGISPKFGRKENDKKTQVYSVGGFIASTPSDYFDILYNS